MLNFIILILFSSLFIACENDSGSSSNPLDPRREKDERYVLSDEKEISIEQFKSEFLTQQSSLLNIYVGLTTLTTTQNNTSSSLNGQKIDCSYRMHKTTIITEISGNEATLLYKFLPSNIQGNCENFDFETDEIYVDDTNSYFNFDFSMTKNLRIFKGTIAGSSRYSLSFDNLYNEENEAVTSRIQLLINLNSTLYHFTEKMKLSLSGSYNDSDNSEYSFNSIVASQLNGAPDTDVSLIDLSQYPVSRYDDESTSEGSSQTEISINKLNFLTPNR